MAKARLRKQHTPREFNVKMSEGEVDFILGVCAHIGGDPQRSPRKYARRLAKALSKAAGYDYTETDADRLAGFNGNGDYITFRNYDGTPCPADEMGLNEAVMVTREQLMQAYPQPPSLSEQIQPWIDVHVDADPQRSIEQQPELPF